MTLLRIFLIFVTVLLSGCMLKASEKFVKGDEVTEVVGQYIDVNHEIHTIHRVADNTFQYQGPKFIISTEERKEILKEIDAAIEKERGEPVSPDRAKNLSELADLKNELIALEDITFQDNVTFTTAPLDEGWFIAQITNVIDEGFNLIGYTPRQFDIIIGRVQDNRLLLYKTSACDDMKNAKANGLTIVDSKVDKVKTGEGLKEFLTACIRQKDLEVGRVLARLK